MPTATTRPFPYPVAVFSNHFIFTSLDKKGVEDHRRIPYGHPSTGESCLLFTLDEEMRYAPFAADHGPLNLAYTFVACLRIHERLERAEKRRKPVCLFTSLDPKTRSNMTLIVALYSLIINKQPPWNAFQPVAHLEVMPFRDAGNGPMDHGLSIQDILYGMDKAIATGLLDLVEFDPNMYQYYETVENGDMNVLGPFIPFASPVDKTWLDAVKCETKSVISPGKAVTTTTVRSAIRQQRTFEHSMKCVMEVFDREQVGLVIRLNDELYDRRHFMDRGMGHVEMYFDDGTNPTDDIVREFIRLADETISRGQKVAVHCKAGLGRTGVLIGAYLIYKYEFSAQEVIGFMRIVRPGMVVGPQQQYMAMNQMKWAGWAARDQLLQEIAAEVVNQEPFNPLATPPTELNPLLPPADHFVDEITPSEKPQLTEAVTRIQSLSSSTRGRSSKAKPPLMLPPKGGDAIGQPRKTPARPLRVDTGRESETSERELDFDIKPASPRRGILKVTSNVAEVAYRERYDDSPSSPITASSQGSMRGTKRGAGRAPLPQTIDRTKSASPRVTLNIPASILSRSSSNASMSSCTSIDHDPRPSKRRTASSSPLAKTGLSSPPPSRETSPASPGLEDIMSVDADNTTPIPPLRAPNKLRRRASPAPTTSTASTPPPTSTLPSSQKDSNAEIASPSPTRAIPKRSFLPVRRNIGLGSFMDPKSIAPVKETRLPKNEITARSTTQERVTIKHDIPATPKRLQSPSMKRVGLTPPRITGMWGQMSKMGSSSPASASGCA